MRTTSYLAAHRVFAIAIVALAIALASVSTSTPAHAGQLIGPIPGPGQLGLVVWSGGSVEEIQAAVGSSGCTPRSAWATRTRGGLIGFLFGAPAAVNASFRGEYADGMLPSNTPLVLVCAPVAAPAAPAPTPAPAPQPVGPPSVAGLAALEAEMLTLVNQARAANGLAPFTLDSALSDVARRHSADMVARGYFAHTNLEGLSPFDRMARAGITYRTAAENIAWAGSVTISHNALMNSPGHRANLLNPAFGRIGIGIVQKDSLHIMVTQNFRD